jgi:hypothetical protein
LAWQQLFITVVAAIVPKDNESRLGLTVTIKILAALVVFVLGRSIEMYLKTRKHRRLLRNRNVRMPSDRDEEEREDDEYGLLQNVFEAEENYEEPLL